MSYLGGNFVNQSINNFKTFIQFLNEANHGIYGKDKRLHLLTNKSKESILNKLLTLNKKFTELSGESELITIETLPPKQKEKIDVKVKWNINAKEIEFRTKFINFAFVTFNSATNVINININLYKQEGTSHLDFFNEINEFIINDIQIILYHELKHALDRIDEKLKRKIYTIKPTEANIENGKYQSQKREINNYLLTLIGDIESTVNKDPNITFSQYIKKSKMYNKFLDPMPTNKKNTLKSKLIDFWINNISKDSLY